MTNRARDPHGAGIQNAEWFRLTYGNNASAQCEVCGDELVLRVAHPPHTVTHFAHKSGSQCSSIESARRHFLDIPPSAKDPQNGRRVREHLLANLYPIYLKAFSISGRKLAWGDFQRAIIDAQQRGLFDYAGLPVHYLPYLLLCIYPQKFHDKTTYDTRDAYFVLQSGLKHFDDLWNKPDQVAQTLWKVSHIERHATRDPQGPGELFTELEAIAIDDAPFYIPPWLDKAHAKLAPHLGL
ncbi:hypothetical protein JCM19000A_28220 [Silvimonas sp. JCM 19000]